MTRFGQTRSPNLAEVLRAAVSAQLFEVHVALPGVVESYDVAEQKIDAKPLLKRNVVLSDGTEKLEELPVITNVPVVFPRGGGFFVSFPLAKGDHVSLIFNERSIDKFMQGDGSDTDPTDVRMHDLSDAVAYPGFYPFSKSLAEAHEENMVIGRDGGSTIHIKPNGEIHQGSEFAADFVGLAQPILDELNRASANAQKAVDFTTGVIAAIAAGIAVPQDGGAALQTSQNAAMPTAPTLDAHSSVAADKVKAD